MSDFDQREYGLEVITEPSEEPITTAEAREQLREDENLAQNDLIDSLIKTARQWVEEYLARALVQTQYTLTLDSFGGPQETIFLPRSKPISVDAVRYVDENGTQQTLATSKYRSDIKTVVGRITPAYSEQWPTIRPVINAVEVDFTAGYGSAAEDVPEPIRQAIKLLVSHYYENRDAVALGTIAVKIPISIHSLLGPYRVRTF